MAPILWISRTSILARLKVGVEEREALGFFLVILSRRGAGEQEAFVGDPGLWKSNFFRRDEIARLDLVGAGFSSVVLRPGWVR